MRLSRRGASTAGATVLLLSLAAAVGAQGVPDATPTPRAAAAEGAARHIGPDGDVRELLLVRSTDGTAVVRFGQGRLEIVRPGDRLGRQRAEVKEVVRGRLVVDEMFTGKDGNPNRARIILADGDRGGQRFVERLEDGPPPATRRTTVGTPRPSGKPPGQPR